MKILFWNICKKAETKQKAVESLLAENEPDLFFVAEANKKFVVQNPRYVPIELKGNYRQPTIRAFVRKNWAIVRKDYLLEGRLANCVVRDGDQETAICGIHYWSKIGQHQRRYEGKLRETITKLCASHERIILIGDFNMSPLEDRMATELGVNAIPWADDVEARQHPTMGQEAKFLLYNPMWNFLGDDQNAKSLGAKGSCCYRADGFLDWQLFDQVICSREMIDTVKGGRIELVKEVEILGIKRPILQKSLANGKQIYTFSDHYPILCSLNPN